MLRRECVIYWLLVIGCVVGPMSGCADKNKKPVTIQPRYTTLPEKKVPPFLKDTILARCDLTNTEPMLISGYGLVVNLEGTGSTIAPNTVRQYIYDLMIKRKWGSSLSG